MCENAVAAFRYPGARRNTAARQRAHRVRRHRDIGPAFRRTSGRLRIGTQRRTQKPHTDQITGFFRPSRDRTTAHSASSGAYDRARNVRKWPFCDLGRCPLFRRCWRMSGHQSACPLMSTRPVWPRVSSSRIVSGEKRAPPSLRRAATGDGCAARGVFDQSSERMRSTISPSPARKSGASLTPDDLLTAATVNELIRLRVSSS